MQYVLKTAPTSEPVTLAEVKRQCRVELDFLDDDDYLNALITSARLHAEWFLQRQLVSATWYLYLDGFYTHPLFYTNLYSPFYNYNYTRVVEIRKCPVTAINSITYVDQSGNNQTVSSYQADLNQEPARLLPAYNSVWPIVRYNTMNAVTIEFVAGYSTIPQNIKHAILLMAATYYMQREDIVVGSIVTKIPKGVENLLQVSNWGVL